MTDRKHAYVGVGLDRIPEEAEKLIEQVAEILARQGWILRSTHSDGADIHFEIGSVLGYGEMEICLIHSGFNGGLHGEGSCYTPHCNDNHLSAMKAAMETYDNWKNLKSYEQMYMIQNVFLLAGKELDLPADMVLYWSDATRKLAKLDHLLALANQENIKTINLADKHALEDLESFVEKVVQAS